MAKKLMRITKSIFVLTLVLVMITLGCKPNRQDNSTETPTPAEAPVTVTDESTTNPPPLTSAPTDASTEEVPASNITQELLDLEAEYPKELAPIASLKTTHPKTYWFIVSWLNTEYKTPDWTGYTADNYEAWRLKTKAKGIDCSGFSRVMLDQIFDKQVAGSSRMLLNDYSTRIDKSSATMGDLVFFKAPGSETDRIVHVGVYLVDNYFVHATSSESADEGLGLKVDSLQDERWDDELVAVGRVKS